MCVCIKRKEDIYKQCVLRDSATLVRKCETEKNVKLSRTKRKHGSKKQKMGEDRKQKTHCGTSRSLTYLNKQKKTKQVQLRRRWTFVTNLCGTNLAEVNEREVKGERERERDGY